MSPPDIKTCPKAVARVRDPYPRPRTCHYCRSPVKLINNREIYGKEYGQWPYLYACTGCDAYVGLHPKTDIPLGTLANASLRDARNQNKALFLALSKDRGWSRRQAYRWLSQQLGLSPENTHWGLFQIATANRAGALCRAEWLRARTKNQTKQNP